jgi:hypothetical protein
VKTVVGLIERRSVQSEAMGTEMAPSLATTNRLRLLKIWAQARITARRVRV